MRRIFNLIKSLLIGGLVVFAISCAVSRVYPIEHQSVISRYADEYGLYEELVYGVIYTESRFASGAVSSKGASGLMQLTKMTADWGNQELEIDGYDYSGIFEPDLNVRLGCWYLRKLINQYGNTDTALAAYNAGSGNVSKWLGESEYSKDGKTLEKIPFKETEQYVQRVKNNARIYRVLLKVRRVGSGFLLH